MKLSWAPVGITELPLQPFKKSSVLTLNIDSAHTLFQDIQVGSRWFSTLYILAPNFHTKRSSHDASRSKMGIVWPSIFQRNWGGPLLGVQGQCFTAPKMRFCSALFCQNWRSFDKQQYFCKPRRHHSVPLPHHQSLLRDPNNCII